MTTYHTTVSGFVGVLERPSEREIRPYVELSATFPTSESWASSQGVKAQFQERAGLVLIALATQQFGEYELRLNPWFIDIMSMGVRSERMQPKDSSAQPQRDSRAQSEDPCSALRRTRRLHFTEQQTQRAPKRIEQEILAASAPTKRPHGTWYAGARTLYLTSELQELSFCELRDLLGHVVLLEDAQMCEREARELLTERGGLLYLYSVKVHLTFVWEAESKENFLELIKEEKNHPSELCLDALSHEGRFWLTGTPGSVRSVELVSGFF